MERAGSPSTTVDITIERFVGLSSLSQAFSVIMAVLPVGSLVLRDVKTACLRRSEPRAVDDWR